MRIQLFGVLALASCVTPAGVARADEGQPVRRPITIIASPTTLKVGSRCFVETKAKTTGRNEAVTAYEGVITRASAEGVGLKVTETRETIVRKTPLAHAPMMNRFFRNVGVGRPGASAPKEVWLPSESIGSVRLIEGNASAKLAPPAELSAPRFASRPSR